MYSFLISGFITLKFSLFKRSESVKGNPLAFITLNNLNAEVNDSVVITTSTTFEVSKL